MQTSPTFHSAAPTYDAIVIGARCAGASTAMLLARGGYRVLLLDRATFPSDTLSTHQIQLPGVILLDQWGLLDRLIAAGTPPARGMRFDPGIVVLESDSPPDVRTAAIYSPRRTLLDALLLDAAREAGVEVREGFTVEELTADGNRITGIRGHTRTGTTVTERARIVIGADGKHSLVAKTVKPAVSFEQPAKAFGYYTYWSDVPLNRGELYGRERRFGGAFPTNNGLIITYVSGPAAEFHDFRGNLEPNLLRALDSFGTLGERVRAGKRADRIYGTADLPNRLLKPFGEGWALVGDAGLVMDPLTGQGIGHAFQQADWLSTALDAGFSGRSPLPVALADYERRRNQRTKPIYDFTLDLVSFSPPRPEQVALFRSLVGKQEQIDRFFGAMTGVVPLTYFFSPGNLTKIIGPRGMARIMLGKMRPPKPLSLPAAP